VLNDPYRNVVTRNPN